MGQIYQNLTPDEITQLEFQAGKKATELIDKIISEKLNAQFKTADNGKILQVGADGKVKAVQSGEGMTVDDTLSIEGAAAEAKTVGTYVESTKYFGNELLKGTILEGYYLTTNNGTPVANAKMNCSDFIAVNGGDILICHGFRRFWWYDAEKHDLSATSTGNLSTDYNVFDEASGAKIVKSPENACYIRFSYKIADEDADTDTYLFRASPAVQYYHTSNLKACIIGASVEAGTTHETASDQGVINAKKAWLTVALRNVGYKNITNLSKGGMGFVKESSNSTGNVLFKDIVDDEDFADYDVVYICLGSNDWNTNQVLGTKNSTGTDSVAGVLKYAIEKIVDDNPYIKVFIILPEMRGTRGSMETGWGWGADNEATVPYTLKDMNDVIEEICELYGVQTIQKHGKLVVNAVNMTDVFPDGSHPNQATMALMAKMMENYITYR